MFDGMEAQPRLKVYREPPRRVIPDLVWIALLVGSMLLVGFWSWIK